ncbi:integrin beta subunit [Holotrichia oblita]|uniref:Integrin beta subunit n=1 Tax=Holotrichia oblita TaxID=644536 RepID=A0ACB9TD34_HOLOL|nr:integrin beta subunit [Holotrichia oblita]
MIYELPYTRCVRAYSYKNHLSLTTDYHLFSEQVIAANVSGNLDAPEGGFDALMQAIVCKQQIGWRENARHLIVFSTDAEFHVAGDGKLAGVFEPNDAVCHMENNEYIKGLDLDYPSVSHLNYIAKENNINLIFAVVSKGDHVYNVYQTLQQNFENSGVGRLDEQSSNVVNLVMDNYNKIVDSVRITDNSTSTVEIKYHSSCKTPTENGCSNLQLDEIVNFTATIKPLECLPGSNTHRIQIKPEGVNEALILELEVACSCDCAEPTNPDYVANSSKCFNNGHEVCGICECHTGYFGSTCECNAESVSSVEDTNCKKDPSLPEICSGLGSCKCGKCVCDERPGDQLIYGKYCECNNFSCRRVKGELCSGPDHGKCSCGKCECLSGWIGEACDCRDTTATCIDPRGNGKICSERGECVCGECQCTNDDKKYSGKYCEECASCPGGKCEQFKNCVECQAYETGMDKETCYDNCTDFNTTIVEYIDVDSTDDSIKICTVIDSVGCTITFRYSYWDEDTLKIEALKEKVSCPEPIDILVVVLGVIASIVLGGLILLAIWKLVTQLHDGREYARFVAEAENAKWVRSENPLYKGASTTFQNPTYGNRK